MMPIQPSTPPLQSNDSCSSSYRDVQLIHAGKGYAVLCSIWGRFTDTLLRGAPLEAIPESSAGLLSHLEQRYREEYIDLKAIEPKISDLLSSARPNAIAQQLDKGRNEFRNSQVHIITEKISGWGITGIPEDKHLRGFGDDVCGRFLCPSTLDWEDPMIREHIRTFQILVTAYDFPKFLWEGERVDPQDMNKGFLRGGLLVKALLSIFIGPAAARPGGHCSGAGGYANILNLQTLTIPSLAFAATVVRYALSAESSCKWSFGKNTPGFNNLSFYQQIITTVGSWKHEDKQSLIMWWNCAILSHVRGGPHAVQLNNTPTPGSAAALMMQQAAGMAAGPN